MDRNIEAFANDRERAIVNTSIVSVAINILLAIFKVIIGIVSNSIAVTLDAVNNLSDALSSIITVIGVIFGAKKPNKKHPLGYGRIEYLSSMIIATLGLYAGITSLVESIKNIISPESPNYSRLSLIIIFMAIFIKYILGRYAKRQGQRYNSVALAGSGTEAIFGSLLSASVFASAIIYLRFNISIESYIGLLIAIIVIKDGLEMMSETVNDFLGRRSSKEDVEKIKKIICEEDQVRDAHDLFLFNYGPSKNYASVHIELPDTMKVDEVDILTRRIQRNVYYKTGVILTGIGVYAHNISSDQAVIIRESVEDLIMKYDWALQMHGFYVDIENKSIQFDVVISFDIDRDDALAILNKEVKAKFPDYSLRIVLDLDV